MRISDWSSDVFSSDLGLRARARGQRKHAARDLQDAGPAPGHGVGGSTNCTFTAVPFWISTLDPLFWITVVMPAAFANAPPSMAFGPLVMFSAWLPLTSPSSDRKSTRLNSSH